MILLKMFRLFVCFEKTPDFLKSLIIIITKSGILGLNLSPYCQFQNLLPFASASGKPIGHTTSGANVAQQELLDKK